MTLLLAAIAFVSPALVFDVACVFASVASVFAGIARLRRIQRKVAEERVQKSPPQGHPGPLVDFVPRAWPGFAPPVHLRPLLEAIERSMRETVEMCFSVPVRHGKTTALVAAVVWILLVRPDAQILYVSYSHGFAEKQVSRAMSIARLLGIPLGERQRQDDWTTAFGGRVKATGIAGQLAGEGFTHIIVDDPHKNRAEAESMVIREGVIEAFWNDIYTRQIPSGTSVFIVHARWHPNDLIGVVSKGEKPFAYHNLPAISAAGKALAPLIGWTVAKLIEIRDKVGPYVWASLYQGNPRPRGGTLFRSILTAPLEVMRAITAPSVTGIGLDFARTSSTRSDHHAAVVMRKSASTRLTASGKPKYLHDILEAVEMRSTITDQRAEDGDIIEPGFTRELARLAMSYPGARWSWYGGRGEEWLGETVERAVNETLAAAGAKMRVRIRILPIENNDKWLRAQGYGATWNEGLVRIASLDQDHPAAEHMDALVSEHGEFNGVKGNKDNLVDAAVAAHDDLEGVVPGGPARPRQGNAPPSEAENIGRLV